MTLKKSIGDFKEKFLQQVPQRIQSVMHKAEQKLKRSQILKHALSVGDRAVDFTLPNVEDEPVLLADLRANGAVVLSFYRGGWCPYCNLELRALQNINDDIRALGAQLVAVSPQNPDESLSTAQKRGLEFEVLSDSNNKVAAQYGLSFSLDESLRPIYEQWGADVAAVNNDPECMLPVPATYIIETDGTILHAFAEEDYTQRMEPEEVLKVLRERKRANSKRA